MVRSLTVALVTLTVSEVPRQVVGTLAGVVLPCTSVVDPNTSPLSTVMESPLAFPSDTDTVPLMVSFPSSTEAGQQPVWVIESVANWLLSTVAVSDGAHYPRHKCV